MNNADHYKKANGMQKRDITDVLSEYIGHLNWSAGDMILDIGCGPGDVTANILLPKLPPNIGHLVGGDLSNAMVSHAAASYTHPKLTFTQFDIATRRLDFDRFHGLIEGDRKTSALYGGVFDKLFSFYCLHWVTEQKLAIKNMYELIKPNGEGLVVFLANCPVFALYEILAKKIEWQPYMEDVAEFVSPYQHSLNPRQEFDDLLKEVGFEVINCRTEKRSFPFFTTNLFKKAISAVNPFVDRIPPELRDEYLNDCVRETARLNKDYFTSRYKSSSMSENKPVTIVYELIIAHFRKKSFGKTYLQSSHASRL